MKDKYPVVTLCGSTRFKNKFEEVQKRLTLQGNIVISVGCFGHWDDISDHVLNKYKEMLDDMHKRKIDMADSIFVINVGGYIGESTKSEIEYALSRGKEIIYLEGDHECCLWDFNQHECSIGINNCPDNDKCDFFD